MNCSFGVVTITTTNMDDVIMEVESILRRCSVEDLRKIAVEIRIAPDDVNDKTKREVMTAISNTVDALADNDQKMEMMKRMMPVAPIEAARALFTTLLGPVEKETPAAKKDDDSVQVLKSLGANAINRYKREVKLNGTIGDAEDDDDLDYVSLCSQIEDWRKKQYTDEEIAIGVRKVVSPNSDLRSFFDASTELTLQDMLTFINAAQKEKPASQLHQQMIKAVQQPNQGAVQFTFHVLKIREKLRKAAEKEGSFQYTDVQVRELFFHALRTGIRDTAVKARIESKIARGSTATDIEIITQLKEIALEEAIRQDKVDQTNTKAKVKVSAVNVPECDPAMLEVIMELQTEVKSMRKEMADLKDDEDDSFSAAANVSDVSVSPANDALLQVIKELQLEVKSMRTELADLKAAKPKRIFGCEHCKKNNKGHLCRHCFGCGAGDHKYQDCTKRPPPSLNN